MAECWWVNDTLRAQLPTLDSAFLMQGTQITQSPLSYLLKLEFDNKNHYVKLYTSAGRHMRRWIARSRVRAEWENLLFFNKLGIPIPNVVAYGESRKAGMFQRGALITQELTDSLDLNALWEAHTHLFLQHETSCHLIQQVALYTRRLHQHKFIHNDLKWRNILVRLSDLNVYFIDCPVGRRRYGFLYQRGVIKDLACLDKKAKHRLSKSARLRFYFHYCQIKTLTKAHKQQIRKILAFHKGRE